MDEEQPRTEEEIRLSREERRAATIRAIRRGKADAERWNGVNAGPPDPRWADRAVAAAGHIPAGARVVDLGCGDMKMERLLPEGCTYIPVDIVRRDERTIVADLNRRVPRLDADFIVGMGVLEYLFDMPTVLRRVARQVPEGLFSYHPLERSPKRDRLCVGWVNALNSTELLAIFRYAGYRRIEVIEYAPTLHFYRVSRQAAAPDA